MFLGSKASVQKCPVTSTTSDPPRMARLFAKQQHVQGRLCSGSRIQQERPTAAQGEMLSLNRCPAMQAPTQTQAVGSGCRLCLRTLTFTWPFSPWPACRRLHVLKVRLTSSALPGCLAWKVDAWVQIRTSLSVISQSKNSGKSILSLIYPFIHIQSTNIY